MNAHPAAAATFGARVITYFGQLQTPSLLPGGVEVMNPFEGETARQIMRQFYTRFFSDTAPRTLMLGINPGRFGGGTTGVAFTSPMALRTYCGIPNNLSNKHELSSRFIYAVVERMGGVEAFYAHFYLGALYPLALIKNGKNYNFYDDARLYATVKSDIVANLWAQIGFGANRDTVLCLGQKNGEYLRRLNDEHGFFRSIVVLDHPRYIMQYKLKQMDAYVEKYAAALHATLSKGNA